MELYLFHSLVLELELEETSFQQELNAAINSSLLTLPEFEFPEFKASRFLRVAQGPRHPDDEEAEEEACIICGDPIAVTVLLDCQHCFHFGCLETWIKQVPSCPICRSAIPTN
jgi:Ring finger domain